MKLRDALMPLVHCIRNYASRNPVQSILLDFPRRTLFRAFDGRFGKPQGCAHDRRHGCLEAIDQEAHVGDSNKAATNPRFIHTLKVEMTIEFVISRAASELSNCNTAKPFFFHRAPVLPPFFAAVACHNVKYTRFVSVLASFSASLRSCSKRRLLRRCDAETRPRRGAIWRARSVFASLLSRRVDVVCM